MEGPCGGRCHLSAPNPSFMKAEVTGWVYLVWLMLFLLHPIFFFSSAAPGVGQLMAFWVPCHTFQLSVADFAFHAKPGWQELAGLGTALRSGLLPRSSWPLTRDPALPATPSLEASVSCF